MIAGGEFLTNNDKPTQRVRCPVHGFIRYSANERKIIDHPAFQRLRHIRQLAMTYLVYPGAMHSRFEHSLGVMELATQAFDLLALRYPERLENELKQIPELGDGTMAKARQIVRLMALLHDVGHPAFSHAAETTIPQTCANREDLRRCNGRSFASNTNQSTGIGGPHSMNRSGNLVYSDDPCSAFMTAIVRSYEENVGGRHYLGRTAVQKVVYFAKVLGVPIPCSFEIYTYGPYSDAVTFCVDSLLADDVLEDTSKDPQSYSNYRLGENADEILNAYRRLIDPHREKIDTVVQSLGSFKPQELELIATLHFIHHRLKQIWRKEPSRDQVLAEFYRVKKDKFSPEEISSWYGALRNARLV